MTTKALRQKHRQSDYFDGAAIEHCPTYTRLISDAKIGSQLLRLALDNAGLRP